MLRVDAAGGRLHQPRGPRVSAHGPEPQLRGRHGTRVWLGHHAGESEVDVVVVTAHAQESGDTSSVLKETQQTILANTDPVCVTGGQEASAV